jgi:hypothetical protein
MANFYLSITWGLIIIFAIPDAAISAESSFPKLKLMKIYLEIIMAQDSFSYVAVHWTESKWYETQENKILIIDFFFGTGAWTQGPHLEPLHHPFFVMGFFETGSCKLFAQAGFEPQSSWSLPPE